MKLKHDDISIREGWWKLGPTENSVGGGGRSVRFRTEAEDFGP